MRKGDDHAMNDRIEQAHRFALGFCRHDGGVVLVYAALLLTVLVGLSALAIDAGRQMSQQTQMQAIADALALAGARELNQQSGAQGRATNAINALVSNGLTGLGYSGSITHSVAFYSALPAAASGFTGTTAVDSATTKYVAVTVAPVTIPSTFTPVALRAGAQAIAGFTSVAVCDIPPVFVCNPYETSGMSDSDATAALRSALSDDATKRRQLRMDLSSTTPGHFGWLVPPDGCNGASCLKSWIAKTHPNTCFQSASVDLNTGAKTNVADGFNVRFDIYKPPLSYSADFAPSVNVRKGYLPGGGGNWCNSSPASPYLTTQPAFSNPIIHTTGTTQNGSAATRKNIIAVPSADVTKLQTSISGWNARMINDSAGKIPAGDTMTAAAGTTITLNTATTNPGSATNITTQFVTSGLPHDRNWTGICDSGTCLQGDGNWDCLDYWNLNHTAAAPAGCTSTSPTVSRYDIYRYEIANNHFISDWSGNGNANTGGSSTGNGENGAPLCAGAGNGVDTSTGGPDRRTIPVAVINCLAQSSLIGGGSTANNIPVAGFGKFFMSEPSGADGSTYVLYGEMSGLIGISDDVRILNQVQLYR